MPVTKQNVGNRETNVMSAKINLINQRFTRLLVIGDANTRPRKSICLCDCGTQVVVANGHLMSGHTKSCGCLSRETTSKVRTTHGRSKTRIYGVWRDMINRCDARHEYSKNYIERGISVCERWLKFENFLADVGEGKKGWTLERVENSIGYEPFNICWADRVRQARNTRRNVVYTVRGITACVAELCERFECNLGRVWGRLYLGWEIERALFEPVHRK